MSSSKSKKERRKKRHLDNQMKDFIHKQEAWDSGRIILEDHHGKDFTEEFAKDLLDRLLDHIGEFPTREKIMSYRENMILGILKFPDTQEYPDSYYIIKKYLEDYWDGKL